ncbi:MAG TPA: hypothetical protein VFB14_00575 [Bryobacteraceae bacterium]|nr:hypothetical protein [Bryobacteraceae bacterium]
MKLKRAPQPWVVFVAIAGVVAGALFGIDRYRHRFVRTDTDLVRLLPTKDATRFFVNVAALRRAGVLDLLGVSKREDPDYRRFVRETGFDYQQDAEAIAGAADSSELLFLVRGRFDWDRVRRYVTQHGGPNKAGRWVSFVAVQPDVLGLAISADRSAARKLLVHKSRPGGNPPPYPVWVEPSQKLLHNPVDLPFPVRVLAIWLQSADPVVLSLGPGANAEFQLRLDASFPNPVTAKTTRNQLEIETRMLKLELARERRQPSADDLTGLLAAGRFEVSGNQLKGIWPVRRELLESLR